MRVRTPDPPRLPKHVPAKNAPDFTHPNKDIPKTHPILGTNPCCRTFRGVCNTPLHGCAKNPAGFGPKPSARIVSGRMQYAPTRVYAKFGRFHIPPSEYAKNAPHFTLPNKDTPKTYPVLAANSCRKTFRGVCNTPLHGYTQKIVRFHITPSGYTKNSLGFRPKPSARDFSGRMQYAPTRVHEKLIQFHIPPPEYTKNPPGFRPKPSAQDISGRMQYAPTRVHTKNCLVSYFRTRMHQKRTRFYHLQ